MNHLASRVRSSGRRRDSLMALPRRHHSSRMYPVRWNIQGVRGQMSANCLWYACKAFFTGLCLFLIGTAMCVVGFYKDGVLGGSNNNTLNGNSTFELDRSMELRDVSRPNMRFSKLSYVGPIVMGVGGFIIVATCVMTFEARDSAAKVGPAAFGTTSNSTSTAFPLACPSSSSSTPSRVKSTREVRSVACQTHGSSLTISSLQLFDRKHIMEAFRKFSKTLRSSSSINSSKGGDSFHRSPSAPSLLNSNVQIRGSTSNVSNTRRFLHTAGPSARGKQRRVPPALRQAMSVDCSNPSMTSAPMPYFSPERRQRSTSTTTSTQTLTIPVQGLSPHSSRMGLLSPRGIYKNVYSTSSECYPSARDRQSSFVRGDTLEVPGSQPTLIFENELHQRHPLQHVNASVHFNPESGDFHLPNGLVTLNVMTPGCGGGSSTSLRTLSPNPSFLSEDSFDRVSAKSEQLSKSPIQQKTRFLTAELSCKRPSLIRQPKVDYSEITPAPDSEDEDSIILEEEEDLSTIPE